MRGVKRGVTLVTVIVALLVMRFQAAAQVATTAIQDTVYEANGTPASGMVVVSWPTFTTAAGQAVAAGSTSATIGTNGSLTLALTPNAGASPAGTYYTAVLHLGDGTTSQQYWVVPVSSTPVTLTAIENQVLPASVAMQTASRAYVDAKIAAVTSGTTTTTSTSYVPITGGTMTGPLVLPADPVTPYQASDKHYVDTNITQVTAGMGQKVSLVPTATQTVAQPAGTELAVNALNGALYASQFQTGDGGNGIANSLASCPTSGGCLVTVDPTYTSGEAVVNSAFQNWGHVVDLRNGADFETFWNPVNASGGSTAESLSQVSTNSDANSAAAGSGVGSTRLTFAVGITAMAGGSNQLPGNIENPPYGKANYGVSLETGNYFTAGQHVQNQHVINCYAVGDCLEGSWMLTSSGGYRDMADEGAHPFDLQVSEDSRVFQGTCASGCTTGSTLVTVSQTSGGGTQGEGRYLIDKNPANTISTGQLLSRSGGVFPIVNFSGTSFATSVFLQAAAAATSQPKNIAPGTVTLPISTSSVPSGFATSTAQLPASSGVACIADTNDERFPNFETASYTVVDASHLSLTLNKVHGVDAVIAVGGLCGYGIEQTVDTVNGVRQVFPVVGSTSSTSLYYAPASTPTLANGDTSSTSGFQNISLQISSVSRQSNVVTATLTGNMPVDVTGLTMTVSGVADTSYNGSFKMSSNGNNAVTYTDTGANSTSTGGTITFVTGGFVLYPMAEVLSVYDSSTKQVDGQLALAPNTVAWAPGDAVEEPHFYQALTAADTEWVTQYQPRPIQYSSAGKEYLGEVGPGLRGWEVQNAVPASNYLSAGGTRELPDDAYVVSGPWVTDFEVDAGTQAVIHAHCNLRGCSRWNSGYDLFELDSATGQDSLFYAPQASTAIWNLGGQQFQFAPSGLSAPSFTASTAVNIGTLAETPSGIASAGKSVILSQSADTYGATSLTLENRAGLNGALFQNAGLDLVDFAFLNKDSYQNNIRSVGPSYVHGYGNTNGEFAFATNTTNQGGGAENDPLYMGVATAQFYSNQASGMVSIDVPWGTNPNAALAVNGAVSVGSYAGKVAAPANGLIVSGSVGVGSSSPAGLLSVGSANQFQVDGSGDVKAVQIIGSGTTPTVSAASGAGSGASASITGTPISGVLTLTTGTGTGASAAVLNVSWTISSGTAPQGCSLMPRNAAAAAATGTVFTGAPSTSGWAVDAGANALAASTSYSWSYQCF